MNAIKAMDLTLKYGKCPECGNENIGNGEGKLIISDDKFIRECKCGWKIEIIEEE